MNILTPFNRFEMLGPMRESGANEFYMGFYDEHWKEEFGEFSDINRLTLFKDSANRYTLDQLEEIVSQIHDLDAAIYITMNAPGYLKTQEKYIEAFFEKLSGFGVDGVIASTPDLIPLILKYHMTPVASTMCGIVNSEIAKFYREIGMQRLILPRELSLDEIASIVSRVDGVQYEAFLMRNGCRYMDANCLGLHGGECGAVCSGIRENPATFYGQFGDPAYDPVQQQTASNMLYTNAMIGRYFHEFACGQCAIDSLMRIGVDAVKIVGRLDNMQDVRNDVELTRDNIRIAEQCRSHEEYLQLMRMPGPLDEYCRNGLSCYYPEARFHV